MNISKIARETGVSVATISRVINQQSGVSEEVRQKTLSLIEAKGYRPRANSRRSIRIGAVVDIETPAGEAFFAQIYAGLFCYASESNVEMALLHHVPNGSDSLGKMLRRQNCNGALLMILPSDEDLQSVVNANIPTCLIANRTEFTEMGFIDCNSYKGALEQTNYLIRLGHRRIGFLCGPGPGVDHHERLAGYKDAMAKAKLEYDPGWIVPHESTRVGEQSGYIQTEYLLKHHPDITAIFAVNDTKAYGAICACVESGVRVPEDISIVGYDDLPSSRYFNPSLTTSRQPLYDMAHKAAQFVHQRLTEKIEQLPRQILESELIVRRSCAPPRN